MAGDELEPVYVWKKKMAALRSPVQRTTVSDESVSTQMTWTPFSSPGNENHGIADGCGVTSKHVDEISADGNTESSDDSLSVDTVVQQTTVISDKENISQKQSAEESDESSSATITSAGDNSRNLPWIDWSGEKDHEPSKDTPKIVESEDKVTGVCADFPIVGSLVRPLDLESAEHVSAPAGVESVVDEELEVLDSLCSSSTNSELSELPVDLECATLLGSERLREVKAQSAQMMADLDAQGLDTDVSSSESVSFRVPIASPEEDSFADHSAEERSPGPPASQIPRDVPLTELEKPTSAANESLPSPVRVSSLPHAQDDESASPLAAVVFHSPTSINKTFVYGSDSEPIRLTLGSSQKRESSASANPDSESRAKWTVDVRDQFSRRVRIDLLQEADTQQVAEADSLQGADFIIVVNPPQIHNCDLFCSDQVINFENQFEEEYEDLDPLLPSRLTQDISTYDITAVETRRDLRRTARLANALRRITDKDLCLDNEESGCETALENPAESHFVPNESEETDSSNEEGLFHLDDTSDNDKDLEAEKSKFFSNRTVRYKQLQQKSELPPHKKSSISKSYSNSSESRFKGENCSLSEHIHNSEALKTVLQAVCDLGSGYNEKETENTTFAKEYEPNSQLLKDSHPDEEELVTGESPLCIDFVEVDTVIGRDVGFCEESVGYRHNFRVDHIATAIEEGFDDSRDSFSVESGGKREAAVSDDPLVRPLPSSIGNSADAKLVSPPSEDEVVQDGDLVVDDDVERYRRLVLLGEGDVDADADVDGDEVCGDEVDEHTATYHHYANFSPLEDIPFETNAQISAYMKVIFERNNKMKVKKQQEDAAPDVADTNVVNSAPPQDVTTSTTTRSILKSVLKRTGSKKASGKPNASKKRHRVQFNESLNRFFDADYVILIREADEDEEEDEEEDDDDCGPGDQQMCTCNAPCNGPVVAYEDCCEEVQTDAEPAQEPEEAALSPPPTPASTGGSFDLGCCCPAFEPPLEFNDSVTLSPPEAYKDVTTQQQHQHHDPRIQQQQQIARAAAAAVERKAALQHNGGDDAHHANNQLSTNTQDEQQTEVIAADKEAEAPRQQRYIVETITMTTVTERRIVREASPQGILKGGATGKREDAEDGKRSVRFSEGTILPPDSPLPLAEPPQLPEVAKTEAETEATMEAAPKPTAAKQLFGPDSTDGGVALRQFEEAKRAKLSQYYSELQQQRHGDGRHSDDDDDDDDDASVSSTASIRRTIERNALRRSLLRYEPCSRKQPPSSAHGHQDSLVERLRRLTCDIDDDPPSNRDAATDTTEMDQMDENGAIDAETTEKLSVMPPRTSPPGEEAKKPSDQLPPLKSRLATSPGGVDVVAKAASSPSSGSSGSSSSSNSTYKKLTDLFARRSHHEDRPDWGDTQYPYPDLGNGNIPPPSKAPPRPNTSEARKQFLSTLAPLAACVSAPGDDMYNLDDNDAYRRGVGVPGDRTSVASSCATAYSLGDIDEALQQPQPDLVAGTAASTTSEAEGDGGGGGVGPVDELALFVQQDAGRIERIRKRYNGVTSPSDPADEDQDDYGFQRRPSVRGIKPRFGSTSEIVSQVCQQPQQALVPAPRRTGVLVPRAPPPHMPVLQEEDYTCCYQAAPTHELAPRRYASPVGTPGSQIMYSSTGDLFHPSTIMRIGGGGSPGELYPARPSVLHQQVYAHPGQSGSPPPPAVHHRGVYHPPYPPPAGHAQPLMVHSLDRTLVYNAGRARQAPQQVVQMRVLSPVSYGPEDYYAPPPHVQPQPQRLYRAVRVPYPSQLQVHLMAARSRSDSPTGGVPYLVARGTQTAQPGYHPPPPPRYCAPQTLPLAAKRGSPLPYVSSSSSSSTSSPTRSAKFERGVPEGAASTAPGFPQDSLLYQTASVATSPMAPAATSPPTSAAPVVPVPVAVPVTGSSVYYAMNV